MEEPESTLGDRISRLTLEDYFHGIHRFDPERLPRGFRPSTDYDLLVEGQYLPPKVVTALALESATGRLPKPKQFRGAWGKAPMDRLLDLGFCVVTKPRRLDRSQFLCRMGVQGGEYFLALGTEGVAPKRISSSDQSWLDMLGCSGLDKGKHAPVPTYRDLLGQCALLDDPWSGVMSPPSLRAISLATSETMPGARAPHHASTSPLARYSLDLADLLLHCDSPSAAVRRVPASDPLPPGAVLLVWLDPKISGRPDEVFDQYMPWKGVPVQETQHALKHERADREQLTETLSLSTIDLGCGEVEVAIVHKGCCIDLVRLAGYEEDQATGWDTAARISKESLTRLRKLVSAGRIEDARGYVESLQPNHK